MVSGRKPDPADAAALVIASALDGSPDGIRRLPSAPRHLSPVARAWYREVVASFAVPVHHLANIEGAAVQLDRARECRQILDRDGIADADRYGQVREHPLASAERQALLTHARLLREAGLDLQAVPIPRKPTRWRP